MALPAGTVTLLFSDIEGSTQLLERLGERYAAIVEWGIPDHGALQRLTAIKSPTLIIQGDNDLMIPTKLSHLMAGLIPDAHSRIYHNAAHGFLFQ
jgi:pimeloyl-ACP methyl ester carboxylesterase